MKINSLKLTNFRVYSAYSIMFSPSKTVLIGPNAVGKTSIIEAIYALGLAKSPRVSDDKEMIKNGKSAFFVEGEFCSSTNNKYRVSIGLDETKKVIKKNQTVIKKMSDHIGLIDCVWFSSLDLNLLFGSPQFRRRNFDRIMCQISKVYFGALSNYKKFLKERNALLKRLIFEKNKQLNVLLDAIDQQLVIEGEKVISIRKKTIAKINQLITKNKEKIGNDKEDFKIQYIENVNEKSFESALKNSLSEDIKRGNTSVGPHKDDYIFIINNKNIVFQGSQGQQRNAIISLKLAESDLIYEVKKEYPILLLDDVFSELDKERQNKLIMGLDKDIQTIITTTSLSDIDDDVVNNSMIIEMKGDY